MREWVLQLHEMQHSIAHVSALSGSSATPDKLVTVLLIHGLLCRAWSLQQLMTSCILPLAGSPLRYGHGYTWLDEPCMLALATALKLSIKCFQTDTAGYSELSYLGTGSVGGQMTLVRIGCHYDLVYEHA